MKIPVKYYQTDSRWKNVDYSAKGESTTIGKAGCGITCMAMVIASLKDKNVTPITTAKWSLSHGYKAYHQGTYYSYFVPQGKVYGIELTQLNSSSIYKSQTYSATMLKNNIIQHLKNGNWIIACMGKGTWTSSGHYVLAYGISEDNKILINDPASSKKARCNGNKTTWLNEIKIAWVVNVPQEKVEIKKEEDTEMVTNTKILVDDKEYTVDRILKDNTNYIKLRNLEDIGMGKVGFDSQKNIPTIKKPVETTKIMVNGTEQNINRILIDGTNYVKLKDLETLGIAKVSYDSEKKIPIINV